MSIEDPKTSDLFHAAVSGDASFFSTLPHSTLRTSLTLRDDDGRSLIHVAAASGHHLAKSKSNSKSEFPFFVPLFGFVIGMWGPVQVVGLLAAVDEGRSCVNGADEEGWAPIHSAVSCGNVEVVEVLIENEADVKLANNGGRTALHYAASKGLKRIAENLVSHGSKLNAKDKFGCTPLHRAASTGNSEMCEFLIEEGAEVDAADRAGKTPLMSAVECDNKEVALLLIRHGADVDVEDKEGYTVLGRASKDLRAALIDAAKAMLEG